MRLAVKSVQQYARHGVQIWRSGSVQRSAEDLFTPAVACLGYEAMSEWHLGQIACCHANMDEAISLAKELNDTNALTLAINWAADLAYYERSPEEVERLASDLIWWRGNQGDEAFYRQPSPGFQS
jgi:hypothetical protein